MNYLCAECVDIAIKNGDDDHYKASDAISLFPVLSVAQTSIGNVANFVPVPLCYKHRKLMSRNKGLVAA